MMVMGCKDVRMTTSLLRSLQGQLICFRKFLGSSPSSFFGVSLGDATRPYTAKLTLGIILDGDESNPDLFPM